MNKTIISQSDYSCITGRTNLENGRDCEDITLIDQVDSIRFYGLADGQSGKCYCREGADDVLKAVFKYISDKGIRRMSQCKYIDELQYEIVKLVRECISELACSKDVDPSEFASTLLAFSYDVRNGDYVLIHIGDGCIIGDTPTKEPSIISFPENGFTSRYTWLTTSQEVLSHTRISFGNIETLKRIIMVTDGASNITKGKNLLEKAKDVLHNGSRKDIIHYIMSGDPEDDAGCIVVDFIREKSDEPNER